MSNKEPKPSEQKKETYSAWGNVASQDGFTPSTYNQSQMDYLQGAMPTLQNKVYDFNGQDTQARAEAEANKQNGLKSFGRTMDDSFGSDMANVAHRFGSLDNSVYDSALKRFSQAKADGLQALQNDYDSNYTNRLSNIQNYNMNNLNSAQNGIGNLYNLANGQSQNALSSSNATNDFNTNMFAQRSQNYNNAQNRQAALWGNAMNNAAGLGNTALKAYLGG